MKILFPIPDLTQFSNQSPQNERENGPFGERPYKSIEFLSDYPSDSAKGSMAIFQNELALGKRQYSNHLMIMGDRM